MARDATSGSPVGRVVAEGSCSLRGPGRGFPPPEGSVQAEAIRADGGRRRYRPSYPMDIAVGKHSSV